MAPFALGSPSCDRTIALNRRGIPQVISHPSVSHVVRTLLRVLGKILRALCMVAAGVSLFGFIFGLFLWQGGDPVGTGDILYPFLFFVLFAAASVGLGVVLKKSQPVEPPPPGMTEEEFQTIEADEKAVAAYERRRKFLKWAIVGSPLWIMGGCIGYGVLDTMRGVLGSSQHTQCLNNMRQFQAAEVEFEASKHRQPRTVEEVVEFAKLPGFRCSAGGTYSMVRDDAGKPALSCSEHGSFDHFVPPKHQHM